MRMSIRKTGSGSFGVSLLFRDSTRDIASPEPAARGDSSELGPMRPAAFSCPRSPWSKGLSPLTPTDQMPWPL